MKKLIVLAIICSLTIITTITFILWSYYSQQETLSLPLPDKTLYVHSTLFNECRATIMNASDGLTSVPTEIPCKIQRSGK